MIFHLAMAGPSEPWRRYELLPRWMDSLGKFFCEYRLSVYRLRQHPRSGVERKSLCKRERKSKVIVSDDRPWFNVSAFSNPASYTFGDSTRDILRGPGFWDWDVSMYRKQFFLPIGTEKRYHLDLRGDFYNVLNHPNFVSPMGLSAPPLQERLRRSRTQTPITILLWQIQVGLSLNF